MAQALKGENQLARLQSHQPVLISYSLVLRIPVRPGEKSYKYLIPRTPSTRPGFAEDQLPNQRKYRFLPAESAANNP